MELSIQERLKDLRVERGLTLEQLAEQTHLSKSALGSYEGDNFKDISHYALIELAKFYEVTVDYLLGLSQTRNHPNADLADLRLSDDMIELLKSGLVDNSLLCELAVHPDFPRLMDDLEIYVNGIAGKQVQSANAIVDAMSATIMKQHNPGLSDPQLCCDVLIVPCMRIADRLHPIFQTGIAGIRSPRPPFFHRGRSAGLRC